MPLPIRNPLKMAFSHQANTAGLLANSPPRRHSDTPSLLGDRTVAGDNLWHNSADGGGIIIASTAAATTKSPKCDIALSNQNRKKLTFDIVVFILRRQHTINTPTLQALGYYRE
ncbi:uncharacterized protein LOC105665368 [Ceratitis capitata]|uniref:(Mediterranean fruit fly) hypothetical protein n=1 Tax=Ceratitis capitata TaxID=7213 RepID=A0A811VGT0_CERCA|nr:uncharacterized protein LOC105665368 [Ceratitis capitata]CAD7014500.1 unnamed protein product [Ceratitis capitata]